MAALIVSVSYVSRLLSPSGEGVGVGPRNASVYNAGIG
jgi:hypothetical protein